jgi:phosphonate transport system substrate-binding protein
MKPLILGAVAYDAKVVTIWDGFRTFFNERSLPFDYVLYTNYERQVAAHLAGHVDVAWNSPLAWLQAEHAAKAKGRTARAVAMRDTDCDLTSVIVTRSDSAIRTVADLKGKRLAVGAKDSPQATLIPLEHLAQSGLGADDVEVVVHDVLLGKHGDHIGGERDAAKALADGTVDAACILDANYLSFGRDGTFGSKGARILSTTAPFDHCNFTVLDGADAGLVDRFCALLFGMKYDDATVRPLMDLEGLKKWLPGRTSGYGTLAAASERKGVLKAFMESLPGLT